MTLRDCNIKWLEINYGSEEEQEATENFHHQKYGKKENYGFATIADYRKFKKAFESLPLDTEIGEIHFINEK